MPRVEQLFGRSIPSAQYLGIYSAYIDFIRRRFNLTTDQNGQNRQTVTQAYEFVLNSVGLDVHAGKLWLDYIEMLKTGPGVLGGSSWQDMQKMDTLRKVYQRAQRPRQQHHEGRQPNHLTQTSTRCWLRWLRGVHESSEAMAQLDSVGEE